MARIASAVRAVTALLLLVSTTGGAWMAVCARPGGTVAAHPSPVHARHAMHGGMHHHAPTPAPTAPAPRGERPDCPVLAMNGGGCLAAADAATLGLSIPRTIAAADAYPPAAGVHDRLLADAFFRPPRV